MPGPLTQVRVIELAGIGPSPFACMMLADAGAEVIRVEPPGGRAGPASKYDVLNRSRHANIVLDLKKPLGKQVLLRLVATADALVEGYRPGVLEKLGIGPAALAEANPKLVVGRMTGWGQKGPYATAAGHDINYIALSGVLHSLGPAGAKPSPPVNLVGDFGGGGMLLAFGVTAAVLAARAPGGKGQVVDAAMVDGSAALAASLYGLRSQGFWSDERGTNLLDGGAHFYDTYECSDGRFVSVGSIEKKFYTLLLSLAGLQGVPALAPRAQMGRHSNWPAQKALVAAAFRTKTRDEWCGIMEHSDVCFAPVLTMGEAPQHPHAKARGAFVEVSGVVQPAPCPRFEVSGSAPVEAPRRVGADTAAVLRELGVSSSDTQAVLQMGNTKASEPLIRLESKL